MRLRDASPQGAGTSSPRWELLVGEAMREKVFIDQDLVVCDCYHAFV